MFEVFKKNYILVVLLFTYFGPKNSQALIVIIVFLITIMAVIVAKIVYLFYRLKRYITILCQPLTLNYDFEPSNTLHSLDLKIPQPASPQKIVFYLFSINNNLLLAIFNQFERYRVAAPDRRSCFFSYNFFHIFWRQPKPRPYTFNMLFSNYFTFFDVFNKIQ